MPDDLRSLGLRNLASWLGRAQSASKRNAAKLEAFAANAFDKVNREFKATLARRSVNPELDAEGVGDTIASGELRDSLRHSVTVTGRGANTEVSIRIYSTSDHYAAIDDAENRDANVSPERIAEWLEQKFGIPNQWSTPGARLNTDSYPRATAKGLSFSGSYRLFVISIWKRVRQREAEKFYQGLHLTEALRESLSIRRGKSGLVQRVSEVIKSAYAFDETRAAGDSDISL